MAEKPRRKDEPSGKRGRGRPVEKEMPEPIPDTPENVARALLSTPPKDDGDWDYMKACLSGYHPHPLYVVCTHFPE